MIKKLILSTCCCAGWPTRPPVPPWMPCWSAACCGSVSTPAINFEMTNKQGQYIGFDVDLAKMVAKEMGVKVEFVNTAWDGIIPALLTDKFDVIMGGMTVTPQRNLRVNFADPYIVVGQTIVLRKDKAGEIKSFTDLNDPKYKIAVKLGTTGEQAVKRLIPKATLLQFETQDDAKLEVINGKVDAFSTTCPTTPSSPPRTRVPWYTSTSRSPSSRWPGPSAKGIRTPSTGSTTTCAKSRAMAATTASTRSGSNPTPGLISSSNLARGGPPPLHADPQTITTTRLRQCTTQQDRWKNNPINCSGTASSC